MGQVAPWGAWLVLNERCYAKVDCGYRLYALKTMPRIHLMQHWYGDSARRRRKRL